MTDDRALPAGSRTELTVIDPGNAPIIFFEGAPNFGSNFGIINVTLAANRHLIVDGKVNADVIAVAFLRCNVGAAMALRKALDDALLLGAETEGEAN